MEQNIHEKAGRPSHFTQELADEICACLSEGGKSLRTVCKELGINHSTVLSWARDRQDFSNQYARAREIGADAEFDSLIEEASEQPPTVKGFVDTGWVAWKKNLLDVKKWSLSKRRPKKYGDRTTLAGDPEAPLLRVEPAVDLSKLEIAELEELHALIAKATPAETISQTRNTELLESAGGMVTNGK